MYPTFEDIQYWFSEILAWFYEYTIFSLGVILTVVGLIFTLSELRVYIKHESTSEQLMMWSMVLTAGVSTLIFNDIVLGILLGISILMIVETIRMWDTPVWGQLMAATTASYLTILAGKIGQMVFDYITQPAEPNDQIFSAAWNVAFYVFIAVAFYFFGKKFILVSRFSSPQMVYLFLFGVLYIFIAEFFPRTNEGYVEGINYLDISGVWRKYIMFADFGTFEALAIVMIFMYFISGWLLNVLMGVEEVTDPEIIAKVQEVARTMGIEEDVKVGFVRAPILNAFAYGPWFDKRIAFISNDIYDFTDSDIRGIVGHELAHAANHHVLLLLLLSIGELGLKKGLGLPATTLDYTLLPDTAVLQLTFIQYYIFSYGLLVFLLIFVRILEGHADKKTKEAGYGKDLGMALYRLEGFYNGVASDFGISVNLLTDRTYSEAETRRFTALAGKHLYSEVLSPTRMSAFANIFQSHPRTSYRIASLVNDDFNPMKAAFLPYRLIGFFFRKGAIKQLNSIKDPYHNLIDETYTHDHGKDALEEVLEYNPLKEPYMELIGKPVVAYNQFENKVIEGEFKEVITTKRVTSPVHALIGDEEVDLSTTTVKEYRPGEKYVLRNGDYVTLENYKLDEDDGLIFEITNSDGKSDTLEMKKLGKPTNYFSELEDKQILIYDNGLSKLAHLEKLTLNGDFKNSTFTINGEEYMGRDFIVGFQPMGFEVRQKKIDDQMPLLKYLVGKKAMIYTKDNFDVSISGEVQEVNEKHLILRDADGDHDLEMDKLEYIMFSDKTVELIKKEHIPLFTKFGVLWANRNKFNYVN